MKTINITGTDIDIFSGVGTLFLQIQDGDNITHSIMIKGRDTESKNRLRDKANIAEKALRDG